MFLFLYDVTIKQMK